MSKKFAKRFNSGKLRYELIPDTFKKELARVFTMGAEKYNEYDESGQLTYDASDNWRLGQPWLGSLASVIRHLEAFERGEDFDYDYPPEILEKYGPSYHLANAAWGISVLMEYYKLHPELDNRKHPYLNPKKIGLDIDEVLCAWVPSWCNRWGMNTPTSWFFDRDIMQRFDEMRTKGELDDFYLNLDVLTSPNTIPFEPHCYITSRPVSSDITQQWLDKHGFPHRPVYTVELGQSKVDLIKESGCEIYVDDRFDNFVQINQAGICCYLFDAPHNQRYDVGYRRIKSLKELI